MMGIDRLVEVMRQLRDPTTGCPWDVAQTFASIAPYTIEEAYEVADAIARGELTQLCGELGDLLFQVVFHAQLAAEQGIFDFESVADHIVEKMVRRHPHVFAGARIEGIAQQSIAWEEHKVAERTARGESRRSLMDDVPRGLAALKRAHQLQKRAAQAGFDWTSPAEVMPKLGEELEELRESMEENRGLESVSGELGDLLFTCVNLARHLGVDADSALRQSTLEFERRFRCMEELATARGCLLQSFDGEGLESLWDEAKKASIQAGSSGGRGVDDERGGDSDERST